MRSLNNPVSTEVSKARASGYADPQIVAGLAGKNAGLAQRIALARRHGYSDGDIVGYWTHFSTSAEVNRYVLPQQAIEAPPPPAPGPAVMRPGPGQALGRSVPGPARVKPEAPKPLPDLARVQSDVKKLIDVGASREQIKGYLGRIGITQGQMQAFHDATARSRATPGFVRSVNQGFTFNHSDELDASSAAGETYVNNALHRLGLTRGAPYTPAEAYDAVMQSEANASHAFAQKYPVTNFAAGFIGGAANPLTKAGGRFVVAPRHWAGPCFGRAQSVV